MRGMAHWDDVAAKRRDAGDIGAGWSNLGEAIGSVTAGLRLIRIDPGKRSTPVHVHGAEEEIFFILGGRGLLWQGGAARLPRPRPPLGRTAGAKRTGLNHVTIAAGAEGWPPHCHSAEEEIFAVLGGDGSFRLGDEEQPVRRGHLISCPAGTGAAHSWRAGTKGLTYLAYGTREPNDIAYYPRSRKISLRGIGVIGRIEPADYWDGEA